MWHLTSHTLGSHQHTEEDSSSKQTAATGRFLFTTSLWVSKRFPRKPMAEWRLHELPSYGGENVKADWHLTFATCMINLFCKQHLAAGSTQCMGGAGTGPPAPPKHWKPDQVGLKWQLQLSASHEEWIVAHKLSSAEHSFRTATASPVNQGECDSS